MRMRMFTTGVMIVALASVVGGPVMADDCPSPPVDADHGKWGALIPWGGHYDAIHMILLRTGDVLCANSQNPDTDDHVWLISPPDYDTVAVPDQPEDTVECSGHAQLADGRIVFAGGGTGSPVAHDQMIVFDPGPNTWELQQDLPNGVRWYPTCTTMGDGKVLVLSGLVDIPLIFNAANAPPLQYRALTDAERDWPYYPFTFQLPNGKILQAGSHFWSG